jgi:hypothetical protein
MLTGERNNIEAFQRASSLFFVFRLGSGAFHEIARIVFRIKMQTKSEFLPANGR